MRSILPLLLLAALARTAAAGPGEIYTFICKPELHIVGGAPVIRMVRRGLSLDDRGQAYGSQCIEGCYVEPLRLVPDGAIDPKLHYLALLEPAGGATCTSTATIVFAIPLAPLDALFGG